jgi:hypothetical protein
VDAFHILLGGCIIYMLPIRLGSRPEAKRGHSSSGDCGRDPVAMEVTVPDELTRGNAFCFLVADYRRAMHIE